MFWKRRRGGEKRHSDTAQAGGSGGIPAELDPEIVLADVPRAGDTFAEGLQRQRDQVRAMVSADSQKSAIYQVLSQETIVKELCPVGSIYMTSAPPEKASEDDAARWMRECTMFGRFAVSQREAEGLADAVHAGKVMIGFESVVSNGCPLLRVVVGIFDTPSDPYLCESLADVANSDLQDYLAALALSEWQWLSIYQADAKLIARSRIEGGTRLYCQLAEAFLKVTKEYGKTPRSPQELDTAIQAYFAAHPRIVSPRNAVRCKLYAPADPAMLPKPVWDPKVNRLIAELVTIGRNEGFLSLQGGGKFGADGRHMRTREIGSQLDALGGVPLMRTICEEVRMTLGSAKERELESAWNDIGQWRG